MAQLLMDLCMGFIKADQNLTSLQIPEDISKICAEYIDIDVIVTTKDYPACDYNIPYVFKTRESNDITLYFGCDSYKITSNDYGNKIVFHLPYCYLKEAKEWYRVHGGAGNLNGILAAMHLSYIMKLEYSDVSRLRGEYYGKAATNKLRMMCYRWDLEGTLQKPNIESSFQPKGLSANDMEYFTAKSNSDMIIVHQSK